MFRVHTPIIRSTGCWVAAYGFLHRVFGWVVVLRAAARSSAPKTWPTQLLSWPPLFQKLGAENHMLQLNIQCSWWWAYVPETCRTNNTSIKLRSCIKLALHFISLTLRVQCFDCYIHSKSRPFRNFFCEAPVQYFLCLTTCASWKRRI